MKTFKNIALLTIAALVSWGATAQDDVYYNPKSNTGSTKTNTDYQTQFDNQNTQTPPAAASDYDAKRDGYAATDPNQYSTTANNSNSSYGNSYDDDDYFFDDFSYAGRLNRYYRPTRGLTYWDNFYDPFYWNSWNRPVVVIQTGYYQPWYSTWRYNICYSQPWRCQLNTWGSPWGGGFNNGWGGGWNNGWGCNYNTSWNNGWGGGYNNPYWQGYQAGLWNAGYQNGYYGNYGYGGYGGYNGYYGNNNYYDTYGGKQYSSYGPRKQSASAGSNTTDGQIERAKVKYGKTDETNVPREGIVTPTPGRGNVTGSTPTQNDPTKPVGANNPAPNGNTGVVGPGQLEPRTANPSVPVTETPRPTIPTQPRQYEQRPVPTQPRQYEQPVPVEPRQMEERPVPTQPRQYEQRPAPAQTPQYEQRPAPTQPRQYEQRPAPQQPRQYEAPQQAPSQPRQFESRPAPSQPSNGGGRNFGGPR